MKRARIAANIIAALSVAGAGAAYARGDGATLGEFPSGRFVKTTTLVPKIAPQSPPPAAPQSRPSAPPHPSTAPPQSRPYAHAPYRPGGFPHHRDVPHYRPYYAPPIIVPRYVPPPAYYGYEPVPYVAPPPAYYDYRPPVYAAPPPAYVERDDGYWYYCAPLGAYYPDVTECPDSWVPVPPR